jgi:hypothetical protein
MLSRDALIRRVDADGFDDDLKRLARSSADSIA